MYLRLTSGAAAALLVTACQTVDVLTFREDPNSGVTGQAATTLYIVDRSTDLKELEGPIAAFEGLGSAIKQCQAVSRPSATVAGPIAAAVAGLVVQSAINAASEAIQERVEALKQASKKGYSGVAIIDDAGTLGAGTTGVVQQCLLLVRTITPKGKDIEAASAFLIAVVPRGKDVRRNSAAVVFTPIYARIEKAAAVTRSGQPVNAAVGLSVVAVVVGKNGPERREVSLGAFQLDSMTLGKTESFTVSVKKPGVGEEQAPVHPGTGLMALPPANSAALELRVAIVETGSALPDFDKSKAEIQAARDALGPATKDAVVKAISD